MDREIAEKIYCSIPHKRRAEWVRLLTSYPELTSTFLDSLLRGYTFARTNVISEVITALDDGTNPDSMTLFIRPEFSESQIHEIRLGLKTLSESDVKLYAKVEIPDWRMKIIRELLESGIETEKVEIYLNFNHNAYCLKEVELAIRHNLDVKQIKYIAKPEYSGQQMKEIRLAFENGLSFKQVHFLAKAMFEPKEMRVLRETLEAGDIDLDLFEMVARLCFDAMQMKEIIDGIKLGFNKEQLSKFALPNLSIFQMQLIKQALLKGYNDEIITLISNPTIPLVRINLIYNAIFLYNMSAEKIEFIASNVFVEEDKMEILVDAMNFGVSLNDVKLISKYDIETLKSVVNAIKCGITLSSIFEVEEMHLDIIDYINAEIGKKLRNLLYNY